MLLILAKITRYIKKGSDSVHVCMCARERREREERREGGEREERGERERGEREREER